MDVCVSLCTFSIQWYTCGKTSTKLGVHHDFEVTTRLMSNEFLFWYNIRMR